ncbi:MAG: phage tail tape-measure protein [Mesorhizobium sp.]
MADVATLGLSVESSQVEKGTRALDQLTNSARRAEAAANGVSSATKNAGAVAANANTKWETYEETVARLGAKARGSVAPTNAATVAVRAQSAAVEVAGQRAQVATVGFTAFASALGLVSGIVGQFVLNALTVGIGVLIAELGKLVDWAGIAASALNGLADVIEVIAPYVVGAAAALALLYAPAILGGVAALVAGLWGLVSVLSAVAVAFIAANPATAFVLGITAAVAAANIFRDELAQIFGRDIVADAKNAVNFVIGAFVGAFAAIKATWSALPAAIGDFVISAANGVIGGVESMINKVAGLIDSFIAKINSAMKSLPFGIGDNINIGSIGTFSLPRLNNPNAGAGAAAVDAAKGAFGAAMNTDYVGATYDVIAKGASAASGKLKELAGWLTKVDEKAGKKERGGGGKSEADKYQDIVDGANRRIASLQAEQAALGLTETEALRLKYTQDLLNQAQQKGITLTAAQRAELAGLANTMATTAVATKKAKEAFEFAKDATKGFLSDLRQGLANGEGFWKSFGNAALNVLNKIIDKIETQLVDALFSASSAGGGLGGGGGFLGTILGGIGNLLGFASGGYTGNGAASRVAGVVHGGEYVFSKKATDRIGIGALDQLHRRAKGYAGGGHVSETPRFYPAGNQNVQQVRLVVVGEEGPMFRPTIKAVSNGVAVEVVDQRTPAHVQNGIAQYDKGLPSRIAETMERNG